MEEPIPLHMEFQSPPPARKATRTVPAVLLADPISIPASRTEGDRDIGVRFPNCVEISIPASRTEGDPTITTRQRRRCDFNPRLPHGRRLLAPHVAALDQRHFNPRLPHGRRPEFVRFCMYSPDFNPRLPHGRRHGPASGWLGGEEFQSPPPARKATTGLYRYSDRESISIPASRTEGDHPDGSDRDCWADFNPRLPHGRRPSPPFWGLHMGIFQSPPPARKATKWDAWMRTVYPISIPASRTEGDVQPLRLLHRRQPISIPASRTEGDS